MTERLPGILFTFDDGPDAEWTPRFLDILSEARVRAMFFVIGHNVRAAPTVARRILREGHALGNHTYSHRHPWSMSTVHARLEVRDGMAAIADTTGAAPAYFRPPHGRLRRCMVEEAAAHGQTLMLWTRSAVDWGPFATKAAIARRLGRIRAGDIVLMHDGASRHNAPQVLLPLLPAILCRAGTMPRAVA